ncbi:cytochrome b562 [Haloferula chungangensis]|uniref:Cytochrome b562 n=1 Tax=Haloferula chungangensis TaxID=1048331 RepID=A0ABW2L5R3_9BACT
MKKFLIPMLLGALMPVMSVRADDSPVAKEMEVIDDAYKALRRTDDAAEGAKLARAAQAGVLKAITMTPEFIEAGGHAAGKEAGTVEYKKQMAQLFIIFCDVEAAFLAKDFDKVQELVGALKDSKKKGHEEFMEDE